MESQGEDNLQNDGHSARVEWPVIDGVDDLESMFFDEKDSGLDEQREVLGEHLYSTVDTALTLISNSRRAELKVDDFDVDGESYIVRRLSWKSTNTNLGIHIMTLIEDDVTGEQLGEYDGDILDEVEGLADVVSSNDLTRSRCRLNGPDGWNSVIAEKLDIVEGKVEVAVFHECEAGDGDASRDLLVFQRYIFPDIRVSEVDWMEVTPTVAYEVEGAVNNPLLLISDALKLGDKPAETGLSMIDDFLVTCGRDKISEQLTALPGGDYQVAGEEDSVMQFADTLKELAQETIKSAFEKIEQLHLAIRFPTKEAAPSAAETVVAAVCSANTGKVNSMLKTVYESGEGNFDSVEFGTAIVYMAEMASMRGDLPTTLEYCNILEMLPPEDYDMFLGMTYFAAARLGDADSKLKLDRMLEIETQAAFIKKKDDSEDGDPYSFAGEHPLLLAISSEYIEYGMSPDEFIDKHTMYALPGEFTEVEEEIRWNFKVETADYKRILEKDPDADRRIDEHIEAMCNDELGGLDPTYVWTALPRAYELTDNDELKVRIIDKYLELAESIPSGEEDSITAFVGFNLLAQMGYSIIDDAPFVSKYPKIPARFLEKLTSIADSVRPFTNIAGEIGVDEVLQHFNLHSTVASGESTDLVIAMIDKEVERREKDIRRLAESGQATEEFDLEDALGDIHQVKDELRSCAAAGYALMGKFGDSQTMLSLISGPRARKKAYVSAWLMAKNTNQVQILAPDEVTGQVFFEADDEERPATDELMASIYKTALVTVSGKVDMMVGRAKAVSMIIASENSIVESPEKSGEISDDQIESSMTFNELMYQQLDSLVLRIAGLDEDAAQSLASSLLPERLKGPVEFKAHSMLDIYYSALGAGLKQDALEVISSSIADNPSKIYESRASYLAEYTKNLYRKQFTTL